MIESSNKFAKTNFAFVYWKKKKQKGEIIFLINVRRVQRSCTNNTQIKIEIYLNLFNILLIIVV